MNVSILIGLLFILFGYITYRQGEVEKKASKAQLAREALGKEVHEIKDAVKKTHDQQAINSTNFAVMSVQLKALNDSQKEIQESIKFLIASLVKGQEGG